MSTSSEMPHGVRARLENLVFGSPAGRPARAPWVLSLVLLVAGVVVVFLRLPASGRNTLWAEDGSLFLNEAYRFPLADEVFTPYAGYMHLYPRIVAELVTLVAPTEWLGVAVNLFGALAWSVAALCVVVFLAHRLSLPTRIATWALILLLPVGAFEVATNVANSHWFLMVALFCVLAGRSRSVPSTVLGSAVVLFAVMSDPLTLLFAPLVLARGVLVRSLRQNVVGIVYVVSAVVQLIVVSRGSRDVGESRPGPVDVALTYLVRVVTGDLVGPAWGNGLLDSVGLRVLCIAMAGILVGLGAAGVVLLLRGRGLVLIALMFSIAWFCVVTWLTWSAIPAAPDGEQVQWAGRYTVVPASLLIISVMAALDPLTAPRAGRRAAAVLGIWVVLVGWLLWTGLRDFQNTEFHARGTSMDQEYPRVVEECATGPADEAVTVATAPDGWSIAIPCTAVR